MASVSLDYPYLAKIRKTLINDYYTNPSVASESEDLGRLIGGSDLRNKQSIYVKFPENDDQYIQPGNSPYAPYLSMDEENHMNSLKKPYEYYQGSGKLKKQKPKKKGGKVVPYKAKKEEKVEKEEKPKAKGRSFGHKVISTALDAVPYVLPGALAFAQPELAPLAPVASFGLQRAREALRDKTGYGKLKRKPLAQQLLAHAQPYAQQLLEQAQPYAQQVYDALPYEVNIKKKGGRRKGGARKPVHDEMDILGYPSRGKIMRYNGGAKSKSSGLLSRSELIRKIMAEEHCSLPQASHKIKAEKMPYKK